MASPSSTCDDLLDSIKASSFFVNNPSHILTDTQILAMATEELKTALYPKLKALNLGYYLENTTYSLSGGSASVGYRIPARAVGNTISKLYVVDSDGNKQVVALYPETSSVFMTSWTSPRTMAGPALTAYVRNAKVFLDPFPTGYTSLVIQYYNRPGDLIKLASCSTIESKTSTSITVVATFTGLASSVALDVIDYTSPYIHKGIGISGTLSTRTISGLSDTSDYAVGDYVALANQSPVPQLPDEWMMLLRFYTLRRIQIAAGYMQDAGATQMLIQEKEQDLISLISPRLDGQPNIIPANEIFGGNGYNW